MIKTIEGNAIDYVLDNPDKRLLLQACNSKGVMGSGFAKQVKERIPTAFKRYLHSGHKLGTVSWSDGSTVANMVTQENYGYDGKRYTDYGALAVCLFEVKSCTRSREYVIPYKMCSDRGGADWVIVKELCEGILAGEDITYVKLP